MGYFIVLNTLVNNAAQVFGGIENTFAAYLLFVSDFDCEIYLIRLNNRQLSSINSFSVLEVNTFYGEKSFRVHRDTLRDISMCERVLLRFDSAEVLPRR